MCTDSTASPTPACVSCLLDQFSGAAKHVSIGVNYTIPPSDRFFHWTIKQILLATVSTLHYGMEGSWGNIRIGDKKCTLCRVRW